MSEPTQVNLEQALAPGGAFAPTPRWQRGPGKWFKVVPGGVIEVSEDELRAFEKTNHESLRGVNAQGRLDRLVAAKTTELEKTDDAGQVV